MSEQRISPRRRVLKTGTIAFKGAGIDCVVRNISADGAALEVESQAGIPAEFDLVISTEQFSKFCRVQWRKAKRLGVVFQPEDSGTGAPPLAPVLPLACQSARDRAEGRPAISPLAEPPAARIRSQDGLPEHRGPSIAPDRPD